MSNLALRIHPNLNVEEKEKRLKEKFFEQTNYQYRLVGKGRDVMVVRADKVITIEV